MGKQTQTHKQRPTESDTGSERCTHTTEVGGGGCEPQLPHRHQPAAAIETDRERVREKETEKREREKEKENGGMRRRELQPRTTTQTQTQTQTLAGTGAGTVKGKRTNERVQNERSSAIRGNGRTHSRRDICKGVNNKQNKSKS